MLETVEGDVSLSISLSTLHSLSLSLFDISLSMWESKAILVDGPNIAKTKTEMQ